MQNDSLCHQGGVLRVYSVDKKGNEHIIQFALEGWTISDLYSFMTGDPATYYMDALEDAELVLISKTAQEELLKKVPKYETYTRMQVTGAYMAMQKKINGDYKFAFGGTIHQFHCAFPKYCSTGATAYDRFLYGTQTGNIKPGQEKKISQRK